ncbi:MAG: hypothetical protein SGPRY_013833, partial [Prymnesium sp.]
CPTLQLFVLSRVESSHSAAMALLLQLKARLLPSEMRSLEAVVVLDQLEQALASYYRPSLDAAANDPGASATSIVAALLREVAAIRRSGVGGGAASKDSEEDESYGADAAAHLSLSDDALAAAISRSVSFRRVVSLVSAINMDSQDGSRLMLTHGFDGDCIIAVRVLVSTSRGGDPIAKRSSACSEMLVLIDQNTSITPFA